MTVEAAEIPATEAEMTIVAGKVVYKKVSTFAGRSQLGVKPTGGMLHLDRHSTNVSAAMVRLLFVLFAAI